MKSCVATICWFISIDLIQIFGQGIKKHYRNVINILDLSFYIIFFVYFGFRNDQPNRVILPNEYSETFENDFKKYWNDDMTKNTCDQIKVELNFDKADVIS